MKKRFRAAAIAGGSILGALLLLIAVSCVIYTPEYIIRCIVNREGKTSDYLFSRSASSKRAPYRINTGIGLTPPWARVTSSTQ